MIIRRKVLVDTCVQSLALVAEPGRLPFQAANGLLSGDLIVYRAKSRHTGWKQREVEALPSLARQASTENVEFYTYWETVIEVNRAQRFPRDFRCDLFAKVPFIHCDAAIERSNYFMLPGKDFDKEAAAVSFCRWLLNVNEDVILSQSQLMARISENERKAWLGLKRYRELCAGLNSRQWLDAFHLWTAECCGIEYFLTIDKKFINALQQTKRIELACKPILPTQLLQVLGVTNLDPLPYEPGRWYDVDGILIEVSNYTRDAGGHR